MSIKKINIEELKELIFIKNEANKRNKDRLFKLAKASDDIETIERLRDEFGFKGAKIYLNKLAKSSLDDAIRSRDVKLLEKFIDRGGDVSNINIIELIIKRYKVDFIKLLIQKGDIDKKDKDERTIIFHASNYNHLPLLLWLLSKEANPNISDFRGATPLLVASQYGFVEIVNFLLKANANINLKAKDNATALSQASLNGHYKTLETLLKYGADVTIEALFFPSQNNNLDILKLILEKEVNVNLVRKEDGVSPLMIASQFGNTKIVKLLIKNKAIVDLEDKVNDTALLVASKNGHIDIVKMLIKEKANINHKNKNDDTALLLAVYANHIKIVDLLIKNYAYVNIRAKDNMSAVDFAWENKNIEIMNILIKAGATESILKGKKAINELLNNEETLLTMFVIKNEIDIVDFWLKNGADINIPNSKGYTPLLMASGFGYVDIVKLLLKNGANINYQEKSNSFTALMLASQYNHLEVCKILVNKKANIDLESKSIHSHTAFSLACEEKNIEILKFFLKNKKYFSYHEEVYIQNFLDMTMNNEIAKIATKILVKNSYTLLSGYLMTSLVVNKSIEKRNKNNDYIKYNILVMCKFYIENGVDLNYTDKNGHDTLSIAKDFGFQANELVELLEFYLNKNIASKLFGMISFNQDKYTINIKNNKAIFIDSIQEEIIKFDRDFTSKNKYIHSNKVMIINEMTVDLNLNNEIKSYDIESVTGKILDIDNNHNPKKLVETLTKFTTAKSNLKHTTHNWDMEQRKGNWKDINSFLEDIKEDWKEIDKDLKNISPNLHSTIEAFLFNTKLGEKNPESKQECIYSWGEYHLKIGWSSPEFIEWCNANPKESPFNYMLEKSKREVIDGVAIDRFSDVINIFKNEIEIRSDKNQLMEIFFNLEGNLPNGFNLDINDSLEGVEFYTDVESFKASLVRIFKMMQEREDCPQIKVRAKKSIEEGYIELYLTQIASTTHKEPQEIIKKIEEKDGGDMGYILEKLSSLCDWRIEYPFDEEKSYRINLLDSKTHKITFKEVNPIEGFTHILRFYK